MSDKTTLDTFKEAKEKLLQEYKIKELELLTMRKELVELGIIGDDTKVEPAAKSVRKRGKHVKLNEAQVIKFFGNKELSYKEVAEHFGKSAQTTRTWLDNSKKFSRRNENPKNKKSKVLYKVK